MTFRWIALGLWVLAIATEAVGIFWLLRQRVYVGEDGTLLPPEALRRRIEAAGIIPGRPLIVTCGSGVSACALIHALHLLGHDDAALYDGAWAEWGGRSDTPIQSGTQ